jgi:CheY-like chemotaxis protein
MQKLILLIDDDQDELLILQAALASAGVEGYCLWAQDMDQALSLLRQASPDYIFIDYNMPCKNGLECLAEIKEMKALERVPVIMYSTHISKTTELKAQEKGAFCLEKPGSLSIFAEKISRIVA